MNEKNVLGWFTALVEKGNAVPTATHLYLEPVAATAWLSEAETALASIFSPEHPLRRQWREIFERAKAYKPGNPGGGPHRAGDPHSHFYFRQALGIAQAARELVEAGRLRSLIDGVRAQTVSEVLDQAETLVTSDHALAATVLAGGALETHLLHLCTRNGLPWTGEGSIGKYDGAIGQARNSGKVEVYSTTDSGLVGAWGKMRNVAAHEPTEFKRTADDVRRMVDGIREFIARTP